MTDAEDEVATAQGHPMEGSTQINVRSETEADFAEIDELVAAAFNSVAHSRLVRLIRESAHYVPDLSLVAEIGGRGVAVTSCSVTLSLKMGMDAIKCSRSPRSRSLPTLKERESVQP